MKRKYDKIWRNKLEDYVKELYVEQRKTIVEIALTIQKEKNISISREAVRNYVNDHFVNDKTPKNKPKNCVFAKLKDNFCQTA